MTTEHIIDASEAGPGLAAHAAELIAMATRAPSLHNTQPWRFTVTGDAIELHADTRRKLSVDPLGREMLISCGAALFGLRLAVRSLGYLPVTDLFPEPAQLRLLARVSLGSAAALTPAGRAMIEAVPHRHTHRGRFERVPLPAGLLASLQHDALAEGATLALPTPRACRTLAAIAGPVSRARDGDPRTRDEVRRWTRAAGRPARDGVPAHAFAAGPGDPYGWLTQRDFDLGRGLGRVEAGGPPPATTAVLLTARDRREDWVRAGQALYRLLLHAASRWVFASLYTQPLESATTRTSIRDRLALPGPPHMLLQFGVARTAPATARRPPAEVTEHQPGDLP